MADNLNTLYYALELDDIKMQKSLEKDIEDLSLLDDEFNKINATISKTFGQKMNVPIHNDIKQLIEELKSLEGQWSALNIVQKRSTEGENITANYEKLNVRINELSKSMAALYNESVRNAKAQERVNSREGLGRFKEYIQSLTKQSDELKNMNSYYKQLEAAQNKAYLSARKLAQQQEKQQTKQSAGAFKEYIQSLTKQSDISKQMSAYYKSLERQTAKAASEQEKMANAQRKLGNEVNKVNSEFTLQSRVLSNLKTLFTTYISIFAVKSFIQSLAQVRGEFENQQIALRAILRDAEAADKLFGQIKSFAVISPFEFKDLVGYAKQLSAFQVPVNELFDTTKRLADVSAGLGVGMDRIILAYGQVRSAAVLRGQELRQFTEAGIPLVDELAKKFSELEGRVVSAGDVFEKISNRMVSFEMVKEIFEDMTNEGGMFYMMQEKQAESLKGKIANLADAYDIMLNDIGEANDGILKGGVEGIAALFSNWEKVWSILKTIIIGYGAYKAAVLVLTVAEKAHLAINAAGNLLLTAKNLGIVISNLGRYQAALRMTGMTAASFRAAMGGIVGILTAVSVGIYEIIQNSNKLSNELNKISSDEFSGFKKMSDSLENLADKLKNTVQGSEEHRDIIRQINNVYGDYLPFILNEKTALDAVADSTEQVIEAMKKRKMMMAQEKGSQAIEENYGNDLADARKGLTDFLTKLSVSKKDAMAVIQLLEQKMKETEAEASLPDLYDAVKNYFGKDIFRNLQTSLDFRGDLEDLLSVIEKIKKAEKDLSDQNSITFGSSFSTQQARIEFEKLEASYSKMRDELKKNPLDKIDFKNELEKINLSEQIAKIDFKVEYEGMSKESAERLKYQLLHQFSITIDDVNKQLEKITSKEEFDFIRIKDPKKNLDELKSETISSYKSTLGTLNSLKETQASLNKLEGVDEKNIKARDEEINQIGEKLELYKQLAKILGIEDQLEKKSKTKSTKDPNAERLKEQIDLIKKAQAQYEKYLEIMSPDEAVNAIRTDKQFMALDIQFEPNKVKDRLQTVMNEIAKLPKSPELEKLNKAIRVAFTDIDYTDAKKNFDKFLNDLMKELDSYKGKYNFYEQLLGITGDQDLAVNLAFNGDFDKVGEGIVEQIKQGMVDAALNEGTGLTIDEILNLDFTKSADELGISEKLKDFLQKNVDEIGKINFSNALDVAKLVADYQSIQDKINTIIKNGAKEQEDIERNRAMLGDEFADQAIAASKKKTRQQVAALESESFKLTTFYQQLFGNISDYGNGALDFLIDKTQKIIKEIQSDTSQNQLKEQGKIDIEIDGRKLQLTESDIARMIKQFGELNKVANERNPFKLLKKSLEDYGNATDEVSKDNALANAFSAAGEIATGLANTIGGISDTLDTLGVDMDGAFGAALGGIQQTLSSLGSIDVTKPFSIITGAIGAVGGIFKSIFGSRDAKLDKKIKASEKEVRRLQNAYSDLERTIDKALGTDKYNYTSDQIKNIQAQQAEVAKQAQAERDKKKTDKDKVADLERQYVELGQQIQDVLDNIRDEVIGSTADEIAQELGNAFFDAFAAGEDYAEAWGKKVKDIVADIVKRMLIDKLLDKQIGAAIDKYSKQWMDSTGNINTDKVISSSKDFYNELIGIGDGFQAAIEALTKDPYFMQLLGPGEESGEGLSKGIKGVTEDTAQLLASYLNAIRGSVLLQELYMKNIDANVAGIYQVMGGSPNITTTTTVPPEIIAAISEPFKLNNTLLASIDANMANVHSISANALAQIVMIQANTYNTAMATREAVEELRSVIAPGHPKGGSGIKIW